VLLMPLAHAVEAPRRERALGLDMVRCKAVEAFANKVGWHRAPQHCDAPPTPATLHHPKAVGVRLHRHAWRVDVDGS
jgi:hypothetical protein